jgi:hypothetical protein
MQPSSFKKVNQNRLPRGILFMGTVPRAAVVGVAGVATMFTPSAAFRLGGVLDIDFRGAPLLTHPGRI